MCIRDRNKGRNVGFAKLETRGGQCKVTVSIKKIYVGGNPMGVFLLSGQGELNVGCLLYTSSRKTCSP